MSGLKVGFATESPFSNISALKYSVLMGWEARQEAGGKGPGDGPGKVLGKDKMGTQEKTEQGCLCLLSSRTSDFGGKTPGEFVF